MSATYYPLLNAFLTVLWFALLIVWIYLLFAVWTDLFRSHDLSGLAKAAWVVFTLLVPFIGAFVYVAARGGQMQQHAAASARTHQENFNRYVQRAVGGASTTDQLRTLDQLRQRGVLTDAEFEAEKAKLLAP